MFFAIMVFFLLKHVFQHKKWEVLIESDCGVDLVVCLDTSQSDLQVMPLLNFVPVDKGILKTVDFCLRHLLTVDFKLKSDT